MPSGPRKLGGSSSSGINHKQLTPAQAAAAAAERRARDNVWCGAEHAADEVEQEVGQQADSLPGASTADASTAAAGAGWYQSAAAAAAAAPAAAAAARAAAGTRVSRAQQPHAAVGAFPSGPAQPQQGTASNTLHQPLPHSSQQQAALQQEWQQHLQQRQLQQQQRQRKRPAVETVDLTLSDGEDDGDPQQEAAAAAGAAAAAAAGSSGFGAAGSSAGARPVAVSCPCCAASVDGPLDAAVMQRLQQRTGYQQWCDLHRQLRAEQQGQQQGRSRAADAAEGAWTCNVCTLVNPGRVLVCEACLSVKNLI